MFSNQVFLIGYMNFSICFYFKLWQSGFSISRSLAVGSVNGDRINSTMYYMLSQARAPLLEQRGVNVEEIQQVKKQLYFPDRCYEGHHTL